MCAMKNKQRCSESDVPVKLTFQSLKEVTNNFADKLGSGASSEVYRGEFDGEVIAVKKLPFRIGIDEKLFQNEYEHLKRLKHHNIVRLVGFCDETEHVFAEYRGKTIIAEEIHRALCLEFLPNGPLSDYLREKYTGHSWYTRFQIINGMCEGLKYIHEVSVVHLDIKPGNILLDAKMIPKIADFGLSRLLVEECIREATQLGTIRYKAPEYINRYTIPFQSNIYSLGLLIMDIATGEKDSSHARQTMDSSHFANVRQKWTDEYISSKYTSLDVTCIGEVRVCLQIALWCVEDKRKDRPSIREIVNTLNNPYIDRPLNKGIFPTEHRGVDNANDHPTANEPAKAEIQEEEEDGTALDVQQQMPPRKEPSHDASTEASCAVRKNYKRLAARGASPRCVKQNKVVEQELQSKGASPKRAATIVEAPNPSKNTRSKAMEAPNPAKNTRSKKLKF
ncbi:hypothetical protein ZWY2020_031353 [Hordeum vulgare]|nr:hypothetical protein ZWY2020_031353 [Hordeum vulgare]